MKKNTLFAILLFSFSSLFSQSKNEPFIKEKQLPGIIQQAKTEAKLLTTGNNWQKGKASNSKKAAIEAKQMVQASMAQIKKDAAIEAKQMVQNSLALIKKEATIMAQKATIDVDRTEKNL